MDRYAYVNNNPVRYQDPSGHQAWKGDGGCVSKFDCAGAKIKTGSGGLYGQPVNVPENDIPDLPDDKPEQIKPVAVRVADATGIAIDVFSYVTYYLLPNFVHVWSANAFYEPLTHTPLDWRIPENIPDTVWKISGVQVVNHSPETIYVTSVRTSQGRDEYQWENSTQVLPFLEPVITVSDYNVVFPNSYSETIAITRNNTVSSGNSFFISISVISDTLRTGNVILEVNP